MGADQNRVRISLQEIREIRVIRGSRSHNCQ